MLVSEQKPMEEILAYLQDDENIFLLACTGCAEACDTGSERSVKECRKALEDAGKKVTGQCFIDFLCDRMLVKTRLIPIARDVISADSVLVLSCGIGVQASAASIDRQCHPACNTISLGGRPGEWRGEERCLECGDCLLHYTGGICPIANCTKSLVNGPCGGTTADGKCEVDSKIECGWYRISELLQILGRSGLLFELKPAKDWSTTGMGYKSRIPREDLVIDALPAKGGGDA